MMRVSRAEEYAIGQGRAGFQGRIKVGFRADGRITAMDAYVVAENGANVGFWDFEISATRCRSSTQPLAMRWQGIPVLTNTPFRGPQRGPGENQTALAMEPILDKAARKLDLDRLAIRMIMRPTAWQARREAGNFTSAYPSSEALRSRSSLRAALSRIGSMASAVWFSPGRAVGRERRIGEHRNALPAHRQRLVDDRQRVAEILKIPEADIGAVFGDHIGVHGGDAAVGPEAHLDAALEACAPWRSRIPRPGSRASSRAGRPCATCARELPSAG